MNMQRTIALVASILLMAAMAATPVAAQTVNARDAELHRQVVDEINFARTRPQDFIDGLVAYRATIRNGYAFKTIDNGQGPYTVSVRLREGTSAVDKAIAFLRRQSPVVRVAGDRALFNAARRFAEEQARTARWGHISADGGDLSTRIESDRTRKMFNAETIMYGKSTARDIVMALIIDDGVPDRSHRDVIFDNALTLVGTACRPHPKWMICVSEYSSNETDSAREQYRR